MAMRAIMRLSFQGSNPRAMICEAGPSAGRRGLVCFAEADKQKNLGQGPGRQRMDNRDGEENCKAVANRLRKILRLPFERIPLTPFRAHATPRSNAAFETKHRAPAAFPELASWLQSVTQQT